LRFVPGRHALPLVVLWWLVVTAAMVALRPPTPVDETRYLSVAWEMWQSGDGISLRLNGAPYGHKPPLLFWLVDLGWSVFGVSTWWPRLMLAGFALGSLVLVQRLARRIACGDDAVAAMTVMITASSLYWTGFTAAVMFDLMLVFFVLLAVDAIVAAAAGGGWRAWLVLGIALGAGILTKGPVALLHVLPLALLAPWWLGSPPRRWGAWYGGVALAVLIGAAIALAWAVPAALAAGKSFGREIFWSQSAGRMVGRSAPHGQPVWFYAPGVLLLAWPWLLWPTLWRGLVSLRRAGAPGTRFALAWCLPPLVAFTAFAGKQIQYLLPLLPALALLAASGLAAVGASSRRAAALPAAAYAALAVAAVWSVSQPRAVDLMGTDGAWAAASVTVAGFVLAVALFMVAPRRAPATTVAVFGCAAIVGVVGLLGGIGRAYLALRDIRPVAAELARAQAGGHAVVHLGKYHGDYQFLGRLPRPIEVVFTVDAVYEWARAHPDGRAVVQSYGPMTHTQGRLPLVSQPYMGRTVSVWRGADMAGVASDWKRSRDDDGED
jgi:4-amino-4-deoxy-L-arabinose transferase-like glycosyltransferase